MTTLTEGAAVDYRVNIQTGQLDSVQHDVAMSTSGNKMTREPSMDSRMSTTEANVASLTEDVRQLASSIADIAKNMQLGFDQLRTQLNNRGRPQWSAYAAWTAVIISIVGMVGTAVIRPMAADMSRMESRILSAETLLTSRGLIIADVQRETALVRADVETLSEKLHDIANCGSPITDKRLAIIEYRLDKMKE